MRGVAFDYEDGTAALKDIDLSIERGERVAILGPNGAGKSTLLKLAMGLLRPKKGTVSLFGSEMTRKNARKLRKRAGLLFQDPDDQIFMPRVWDDVAFGPINLGFEGGEVRARVEEALSNSGLEDFADRVPHHLSYGEKKRVAIAGILAMKPEVLFLDEPTANLDPKGKFELMEIIERSCDTLVIATHDVNVAAGIAKRGIVINRSVVKNGDMRSLFSDTQLLARHHLDVPDVTKLFLSVKQSGYDVSLPLSVDEAVSEMKRKLKERRK
ncbi:MAG: ATP-binding cassette domain-containing protein [Thermoplasmata archaeon]|nr:MAG: ATP-binding cassette domain-containing protein [Thermoplasmata archaeon]